MILFGFFALVLVAVYWINQAVRLFDRLIGDGQSAKVFAEFTALMLPDVIRLVLPMSAFAAAVYVTNRLSSDSELVVMQSTGFSPWRLARPVLYFGCIIALMMSLLTHILVPASLQQLRLRESEIAQNVTSKLLTEGAFLHPATGITFYVREISPDGNLEDIFLSDRRDPDRATTYSAARAALINVDGSTRLVMFDGMVQVFSAETTLLSVTYFSEFSYDISRLITPPASPGRWRKTIPTLEILRAPDAASKEAGEPPGRLLEEAHMRFSQPLLCIVAALIGFSTLLVGGYSRFGVWRQVVAAFVLLAMLKVIEGIASDPVRSNPELWPLVYSPALFGFVTSGLLLAWAGRTRRPRRYRAETSEAAA